MKATRNASSEPEPTWLLLFHQIPPKPNYFRVKIWRRLQKLGAVAVKNSVYVLPRTEQMLEDFQWVLREIVEGGGEATLCEARLVEGLTDEQIEELFRAARSADYRQIAEDCRQIAKNLRSRRGDEEESRARAEIELARLTRRFAENVAIDFFGAPGQSAAQGLISEIESKLRGSGKIDSTVRAEPRLERPRGNTWVTRHGIHVDRMASAWLIRRFIDTEASFKFVPAKGYIPQKGELRFDMFDAEFTHEGDRCTLEVLLQRFGITDRALHAIAEIVHDIDLKDAKFGRQETVGIEHLITGIAMAHKDDAARLERASALFADLYKYFEKRRA
jgi:hypothetical protein